MSAVRIAAYTMSFLALSASPLLLAEDVQENEVVEVIGVTPVLGVGLPKEKIPYNVQSASSDDFDRTISLDLTDLMNRNFSSIMVNDAQNNPLQPDVQYRGFTASPLLGLPQGLAVYQNGVRVNEVFGDTVNWDLLPEASIHSMNLVGGANPVFGLNTLGGAISIETKNGFNYTGSNFEVYGGMPQERIVLTAEHGGNDGTFGYYGLVQYLDEEGWRDASPSDSLNLYGSLNYRATNTSLDLNVNYADNDLIGNGAIPIELANQDYEAIFTSPDQTVNEMIFLQGQGEHWFSNTLQVSGNAFYRLTETDTFNGDGTEFEECNVGAAGFEVETLVEGDEDDLTAAGCAGGTTLANLEANGGEVVEDQFGNNVDENNAQIVALGLDIDDLNGLNNRSDRTQENYGGTLQNVYLGDLFGKSNQLIVGMAFTYGDVVFDSSQELASLNANRSTSASGIFVPEEGTAINAETWNGSLYITDTFSATDKLDFTFSGRFNHTDIKLADGLGRGFTDSNPLLNGEHEYNRFNPAAGFTYKIQPGLTSYFSYSESSRAPTAVELACADANAPCSLPNGFLADPPLEQVVNKSFEVGFNGVMPKLSLLSNVSWSLGGFFSKNEEDIIFQNTGGVSGNEGFFDNIGDTHRIGIEAALGGNQNNVTWFLNYSYIEATFQDTFQASSANNPAAVNSLITVQEGDFIPNIPAHGLKLGGDYHFSKRFSVGGDLQYNSGVYVRGDESNQLDKLDGYSTVNLRAKYEVNEVFQMFARVDNLFDQEYESFGLLGEPDEVPGFGGFTNNKFVGVGNPISGFIGLRATF
jgi:iron complex outermembrane recepter protein